MTPLTPAESLAIVLIAFAATAMICTAVYFAVRTWQHRHPHIEAARERTIDGMAGTLNAGRRIWHRVKQRADEKNR